MRIAFTEDHIMMFYKFVKTGSFPYKWARSFQSSTQMVYMFPTKISNLPGSLHNRSVIIVMFCSTILCLILYKQLQLNVQLYYSNCWKLSATITQHAAKQQIGAVLNSLHMLRGTHDSFIILTAGQLGRPNSHLLYILENKKQCENERFAFYR